MSFCFKNINRKYLGYCQTVEQKVDVASNDFTPLIIITFFVAGVTAVMSGRHHIKLFPGALKVLQDIYSGAYPSVRIAAASSADTPLAVSIGKKSMTMLEIFPNVTMRDVFAMGWEDGFEGNIQIGRTHPLSSNKSKTHFPILKRETGIQYNKMVFFDDCNWSDHCSLVAAACPGVVTQPTPHGLQESEWHLALSSYSDRYT
jgi:magnesium-dependent phosphatase 1